MPIYGSSVNLTAMDQFKSEEKVTGTYFSNNSTELLAAKITTSSLSDTNENYFFGISNSDTLTTQEFNVAFGSLNGYGSNVETNTIAETKAIYKQFASLLLAPHEVTGGFFISRNQSTSAAPTGARIAAGKDSEIFILTARRSLMKDRLNKKNWTIILSGSNTAGTGARNTGNMGLIKLTDDSNDDNPTPTVAGDRYNIVSGSDGTISGSGAAHRTYGFYYPDQGIMVFSQKELSGSIQGKGSDKADTVVLGDATHTGFVVSTDTNANEKTALRFVNCLKPTGAKLKFRNEEDQISQQYFCRFPAGGMNFSNNPTFVSGSDNEIRNKTMWDNPTVYISQVQLYNGAGDIVAVGSLSTPLKKNFSTEATIKVKLTY
jgi:hypothetical protein